jgi:hypothetical protein
MVALAERHPVLAGEGDHAVVAGFEDDPAWIASCESFAHDTLGAARVKVRDASVPPLWQHLADLEEMPGPRLSFTSAHVTPDAVAFLRDTPAAGRFVFHAAAGRLHVFPPGDTAAVVTRAALVAGFTPTATRGANLTGTGASPAVESLRARLRGALDPSGVFAYGPSWGAIAE